MKFNFADNRNIDDLGKVPENCQAFYEKAENENEGFNLKTDTVTTAAVAVITGQNKALKAVRQEVTDAKSANTIDLSALSDYGNTVEEIVAGVATRVEELTVNASGNESDVAARIAAVKKEHGEAMAALTTTKDGEIKTKQGQLENYMLETAIMHAGSGWQGLNTKLVTPFARDKMRVVDVDGAPQVIIVGGDNEARYSTSPDRAGELMNTDELLEEMSADKALRPLFPSDQAAQGGGATGAAGPVGVRRGDPTKNMTPAQKIGEGLKQKKK